MSGPPPRQPNAYYRLGAWVPRVTLAMGLQEPQLAAALAVARRVLLPLLGSVPEMSLVRVPDGPVETVGLFQLGAQA